MDQASDAERWFKPVLKELNFRKRRRAWTRELGILKLSFSVETSRFGADINLVMASELPPPVRPNSFPVRYHWDQWHLHALLEDDMREKYFAVTWGMVEDPASRRDVWEHCFDAIVRPYFVACGSWVQLEAWVEEDPVRRRIARYAEPHFFDRLVSDWPHQEASLTG